MKANLYVTCRPSTLWENEALVIDGFRYEVWDCDVAGSGGRVAVTEFQAEFEIPEGFDPRPKIVDLLKDEEQKVRAEFEARLTAIRAEINRFTALECA